MADNVQAAVCKLCGGSLKYIQTDKRWRCRYCGTYAEYFSSENVDVDGIARQVIEDVAYRRLDNAEKNLSDCTRKNQKSVATQIATLSYCLGRFASATNDRERSDYMDRFKSYVKTFINDYPTINAEETSFYNSFDNNAADVFANLINLFSLLGSYGDSRVEFITNQMNLDQVFSKDENESLLRVAIKNKNITNIKKILSNSAHIDKSNACIILMNEYSDDENKAELLQMIFDVDAASGINKNVYLNYFDGEDSVKTKLVILSGIMKYNIPFDIMRVFEILVEKTQDPDDIRDILEVIYISKSDSRRDAEVFQYVMNNNNLSSVMLWYVKLLEQNEVFMNVSSKVIVDVMDNSIIEANDKIELIVELMNNLHFTVDNRAKDVALIHYMCEVFDSVPFRLALLEKILIPGFPISNRTVTKYVNETTIDGIDKVKVLGMIFNAGFQVSFARNLLSDYMNQGKDNTEVKNAVYNYLIGSGYSVDSTNFGSFLLGDTEENEKISKANLMIQNGSVIPKDILQKYIMAVSSNQTKGFSYNLFRLLIQHDFNIDSEALTRYLIYIPDPDRARNLVVLLNHSPGFSKGTMPIYISQVPVQMNLVQAYMVTTRDSFDLANQCVSIMVQSGLNVNDKVQEVSGNRIPFDKFISNNTGVLSATAVQLAANYKKQGFWPR